ncbi:MAG: ribonuclease E activity regulator RraA [Thermoflavifilum sp.]|nr:ribonuclease E activity regulator RraA [Thermoflavifilum sp.]MCL6515045.1 ribonuclease E activity regulator RraA [Alicyclobacillus sp.]
MATADLCDAYLEELQVCAEGFASYGGRRAFCGPIETVRVFEDNVLVKQALETAPPGSVVVVDGGGSRRCALVGGNLAAIAARRGLAGIIVYGCIRDAAEIRNLPLGVLALGTCPVKSRKDGVGSRGEALHFGGVVWRPGAWAYADDDGVVVAERQLTPPR